MNTTWDNTNTASGSSHLALIATAILLPLSLTSCGKTGRDVDKKTLQRTEDDFLDKDAKPDEPKYLLAVKPFFIALANRKYADAYRLLSKYATARMSLEQFKPSEQDAEIGRASCRER